MEKSTKIDRTTLLGFKNQAAKIRFFSIFSPSYRNHSFRSSSSICSMAKQRESRYANVEGGDFGNHSVLSDYAVLFQTMSLANT